MDFSETLKPGNCLQNAVPSHPIFRGEDQSQRQLCSHCLGEFWHKPCVLTIWWLLGHHSLLNLYIFAEVGRVSQGPRCDFPRTCAPACRANEGQSHSGQTLESPLSGSLVYHFGEFPKKHRHGVGLNGHYFQSHTEASLVFSVCFSLSIILAQLTEQIKGLGCVCEMMQ